MKGQLLLMAAVLATSGCASGAYGVPGGRAGDVVIVGEREGDRSERDFRGVPAGHYTPPGECRLWYADRPPGHQPPPTRCSRLSGRIPYNAFILYNGKAWAASHDWQREHARDPDSVPEVILDLMASIRRE